jgi:hypothetical protein
MMHNTGGRMVLLGVVCIIGDLYLRPRRYDERKRIYRRIKKSQSVKEFNLVKGLIIATISGILSAFFNFGIEAGNRWPRWPMPGRQTPGRGKFPVPEQCDLCSDTLGRTHHQFYLVHDIECKK